MGMDYVAGTMDEAGTELKPIIKSLITALQGGMSTRNQANLKAGELVSKLVYEEERLAELETGDNPPVKITNLLTMTRTLNFLFLNALISFIVHRKHKQLGESKNYGKDYDINDDVKGQVVALETMKVLGNKDLNPFSEAIKAPNLEKGTSFFNAVIEQMTFGNWFGRRTLKEISMIKLTVDSLLTNSDGQDKSAELMRKRVERFQGIVQITTNPLLIPFNPSQANSKIALGFKRLQFENMFMLNKYLFTGTMLKGGREGNVDFTQIYSDASFIAHNKWIIPNKLAGYIGSSNANLPLILGEENAKNLLLKHLGGEGFGYFKKKEDRYKPLPGSLDADTQANYEKFFSTASTNIELPNEWMPDWMTPEKKEKYENYLKSLQQGEVQLQFQTIYDNPSLVEPDGKPYKPNNAIKRLNTNLLKVKSPEAKEEVIKEFYNSDSYGNMILQIEKVAPKALTDILDKDNGNLLSFQTPEEALSVVRRFVNFHIDMFDFNEEVNINTPPEKLSKIKERYLYKKNFKPYKFDKAPTGAEGTIPLPEGLQDIKSVLSPVPEGTVKGQDVIDDLGIAFPDIDESFDKYVRTTVFRRAEKALGGFVKTEKKKKNMVMDLGIMAGVGFKMISMAQSEMDMTVSGLQKFNTAMPYVITMLKRLRDRSQAQYDNYIKTGLTKKQYLLGLSDKSYKEYIQFKYELTELSGVTKTLFGNQYPQRFFFDYLTQEGSPGGGRSMLVDERNIKKYSFFNTPDIAMRAKKIIDSFIDTENQIPYDILQLGGRDKDHLENLIEVINQMSDISGAFLQSGDIQSRFRVLTLQYMMSEKGISIYGFKGDFRKHNSKHLFLSSVDSGWKSQKGTKSILTMTKYIMGQVFKASNMSSTSTDLMNTFQQETYNYLLNNPTGMKESKGLLQSSLFKIGMDTIFKESALENVKLSQELNYKVKSNSLTGLGDSKALDIKVNLSTLDMGESIIEFDISPIIPALIDAGNQFKTNNLLGSNPQEIISQIIGYVAKQYNIGMTNSIKASPTSLPKKYIKGDTQLAIDLRKTVETEEQTLPIENPIQAGETLKQKVADAQRAEKQRLKEASRVFVEDTESTSAKKKKLEADKKKTKAKGYLKKAIKAQNEKMLKRGATQYEAQDTIAIQDAMRKLTPDQLELVQQQKIYDQESFKITPEMMTEYGQKFLLHNEEKRQIDIQKVADSIADEQERKAEVLRKNREYIASLTPEQREARKKANLQMYQEEVKAIVEQSKKTDKKKRARLNKRIATLEAKGADRTEQETKQLQLDYLETGSKKVVSEEVVRREQQAQADRERSKALGEGKKEQQQSQADKDRSILLRKYFQLEANMALNIAKRNDNLSTAVNQFMENVNVSQNKEIVRRLLEEVLLGNAPQDLPLLEGLLSKTGLLQALPSIQSQLSGERPDLTEGTQDIVDRYLGGFEDLDKLLNPDRPKIQLNKPKAGGQPQIVYGVGGQKIGQKGLTTGKPNIGLLYRTGRTGAKELMRIEDQYSRPIQIGEKPKPTRSISGIQTTDFKGGVRTTILGEPLNIYHQDPPQSHRLPAQASISYEDRAYGDTYAEIGGVIASGNKTLFDAMANGMATTSMGGSAGGTATVPVADPRPIGIYDAKKGDTPAIEGKYRAGQFRKATVRDVPVETGYLKTTIDPTNPARKIVKRIYGVKKDVTVQQ